MIEYTLQEKIKEFETELKKVTKKITVKREGPILKVERRRKEWYYGAIIDLVAFSFANLTMLVDEFVKESTYMLNKMEEEHGS